MATDQHDDGVAALRDCVIELASRERELRDRLIAARDEHLSDQDAFAAMEAELWEQFAVHAQRSAAANAQLEREAAHLLEERKDLCELLAERDQELVRLRERLERIHASLPVRAYAWLKRLPGLRQLAVIGARGHEGAVRRRIDN